MKVMVTSSSTLKQDRQQEETPCPRPFPYRGKQDAGHTCWRPRQDQHEPLTNFSTCCERVFTGAFKSSDAFLFRELLKQEVVVSFYKRPWALLPPGSFHFLYSVCSLCLKWKHTTFEPLQCYCRPAVANATGSTTSITRHSAFYPKPPTNNQQNKREERNFTEVYQGTSLNAGGVFFLWSSTFPS